MHKRLPIHFDNELSSNATLPRTENLLLYSDYPDTFRNITVIDALANVSDRIRKQPAFQPYFVQQKQLAEGVPVDELEGSWSLDKYKFLPILRHAYTAFPNAKWFSASMSHCNFVLLTTRLQSTWRQILISSTLRCCDYSNLSRLMAKFCSAQV